MAATVAAQITEAAGITRRAKIAKAPRAVSITPLEQIAPGSYLGQALGAVQSAEAKAKAPGRQGNSPPSSSSSSSSSSSPSPSSGSSPSSDESSRGNNKRRRRKSGRKKMSKDRSTLKPVPPREYDGAADGRAFHRFVTEGTDYVMTGRVSRQRRVFVLSYYLKGRAYDFYTQKVASTSSEWELSQFFSAMFNYCFPVDFRMKQREKLRRCFQGEKSVSEFVYELEELYNLIGAVDERERVIKLWNGLRTVIQQGLWREGLNPEVSTWDEVRDVAQVVEIVESVAARRSSRRGGQDSHGGGGANSGGHSGSGGSRSHRGGGGRGSGPSTSRPRQDDRSEKPRRNGETRRPHEGQGSRPSMSRGDGGRAVKREEKSSLSKEEKNELLAAGKCFKCRETGHLSRNCPKGNSVHSSRRGPPGIASFNIGVDLEEAERLRDLAEATETIHLGAISVGDEMAHGTWRTQLGDLAAERAMAVLEGAMPYPGDGPRAYPGETRFLVYRTEGGLHALIDTEETEDEVTISTSLLFDSTFNLPEWYAAHKAALQGQVLTPGNPWSLQPTMGDVLAIGLVAAVREGDGSFPPGIRLLSASERWQVQVADGGDKYTVVDVGMGHGYTLPRSKLLRDTFDVVSWLRIQVTDNWDAYEWMKGQPCQDGCLECAQEGCSMRDRHPCRIGDIFARAAEKLLNDEQPYPGDLDVPMHDRFRVSRKSKKHYFILDRLIPQVTHVTEGEIQGQDHRLGAQYAVRRAEASGQTVESVEHSKVGCISGYLADWVCQELTRGAPYSADRGFVRNRGMPRFVPWLEHCGPSGLVIADQLREYEVFIPVDLLQNQSFDLQAWYAQRMRDTKEQAPETLFAHGQTVVDEDDSVIHDLGALQLNAVGEVNSLFEQAPASYPGTYSYKHDTADLDSLPDLQSISDSALSIEEVLPGDNDSCNNSLPDLQSVSDSSAWSSDEGRRCSESGHNTDTNSLLELQSVSSSSGEGFVFDLPPHEDLTETSSKSDDGVAVAVATCSSGSSSGLFEEPRCAVREGVKAARIGQWLQGVPDECWTDEEDEFIRLNGVQIPKGTYAALERNAAIPKDFTRVVPKPVVVVVMVNGHPARALLDSGSLGDFMSSTLADQLKVPRIELVKPLSLQLAVQGSRSKVNLGTRVSIKYQKINEERYFDIANLSGYDLILGTPWMYQHSASIGLNPARVIIGSDVSKPLAGEGISKLASRAVEAFEENLDRVREELVR
ncbi:hypothetical protein H0H81_003468, partial [Sphagnurus paluster]